MTKKLDYRKTILLTIFCFSILMAGLVIKAYFLPDIYSSRFIFSEIYSQILASMLVIFAVSSQSPAYNHADGIFAFNSTIMTFIITIFLFIASWRILVTEKTNLFLGPLVYALLTIFTFGWLLKGEIFLALIPFALASGLVIIDWKNVYRNK